jgi:hypothetical protein
MADEDDDEEIDLAALKEVTDEAMRRMVLEWRGRSGAYAVDLATVEFWLFECVGTWERSQDWDAVNERYEIGDVLEIHRGWLAILVGERDVAFKKDVIAEFAVSLADGDEEEADIAQAWLLAKQACSEINWPALSVCRAG